ncbi:DUF423 domain-containing protein [Alcaligenaceae bacterium C4P045]|nr:DUF423 domain-containing protein [Alcaligenaceae bacterium C4P045]
MTDRIITILAALNMIAAVGAGAFGAHGLKRLLTPEMLGVWQTAVTYHIAHALGLFILAGLSARLNQPLIGTAAWVMLAGIVMFSGSLYLLSTTGMRWLGPVTPLGGLAFMVAWAMVAWTAYRAA